MDHQQALVRSALTRLPTLSSTVDAILRVKSLRAMEEEEGGPDEIEPEEKAAETLKVLAPQLETDFYLHLHY